MDLFTRKTNLLPFDGEVIYFGYILDSTEANRYFDLLLSTIEWRNDEAIIFGKRIETKRKVAWYGDHPYSYTYSNSTKTALPWTKALLELKALAEKHTGSVYNSCLLNLYHDGSEGMAWHSDGEKMLVRHGSIASLSLGAERNFGFKHKVGKQVVSILLQHGSLLEMKGQTQDYWLHRLPPTTRIQRPRINLTFRQISTDL